MIGFLILPLLPLAASAAPPTDLHPVSIQPLVIPPVDLRDCFILKTKDQEKVPTQAVLSGGGGAEDGAGHRRRLLLVSASVIDTCDETNKLPGERIKEQEGDNETVLAPM